MPNRADQIWARTTQPSLNAVNDAVPGGQASVSGANVYAAQLGARIYLDGLPGGVKYTAATGTLYGGCFQYVQAYLSSTASPAVGRLCAWAWDQTNTAFESYVVSPDTNNVIRVGRIAGVFLNAVTKGNYGWIQTKGKASVLYTSAFTKATPADGDLVVVNTTTGNADVLADVTAILSQTLKSAIGTAIGAPLINTVGLILLKGLPEVI